MAGVRGIRLPPRFTLTPRWRTAGVMPTPGWSSMAARSGCTGEIVRPASAFAPIGELRVRGQKFLPSIETEGRLSRWVSLLLNAALVALSWAILIAIVIALRALL